MRVGFLVPFPVLALIMGATYSFGDPERTAGPSFLFAKSIAPMHVWGTVFMCGAAVLTVALILRERHVTTIGLFVGGAIYTWWGCLLAGAAIFDQNASLNAWAIYAAVGFAHYYAAWKVWTQ